MREDSLLEIENLHVCVDVEGVSLTIIDDVSLSLKAGEILALVGESGCGKSVTAHATPASWSGTCCRPS